MDERWSVVGSSIPRIDGIDKITGRAMYAGDIRMPGMAFGKVLRSPYPHARILRLDVVRALEHPGVLAVLTADDLDDVDPYYGHAVKDRPIVARGVVRFAGEPVAAIAARDERSAEQALDLIDAEYEPLRAVTEVYEAVSPGAVQIHDPADLRLGLFHGLGEFTPGQGNICYHHRIEWGEMSSAQREADIVVEGEYSFPAVYQYSMEPHTVVAAWEGDSLTVWSSCQHPYLVRAELAEIFRLPVTKVRVVVPYLGGGFGSKSYTKLEPLAAALARKAGRPVRLANSVEEAMLTTRRHDMRCWMRTYASSRGELIGRECRIWLDTGAYADNGPRVAATAADAAPGPYRWRAVSVDAWAVYTNKPPAGSYRAFGAAHTQWIGEIQVDEVARRLGMDRLELRMANLLSPGEYVRPGGKPLDADLRQDLQEAARVLGWGQARERNVGRAVAVGLLAAGAQPVSKALVRLEADASATVLVSSTEMGQGVRTVMAQIVAQETGVPLERIRVPGGDTAVTPYDRSTGASRSTTLAGLAVQRAARHVKDQLLAILSDMADVPPEVVELRDGAAWFGDQRIPLDEIVRRYFGMAGGEIIGHGEVRPHDGRSEYAEGPVFWEVCVGGAEVEVDPDTGRVKVRRLVSVADVGKAVNPRLIEGQEMGAALQGLGNALFEEMLFQDGVLLNSTLLDYRIPSIEDLPHDFQSVIVERGDGPGPYGVRGVGEGAQAGAIAAIAAALWDAGVRVTQLPCTPERCWRALRNNQDKG